MRHSVAAEKVKENTIIICDEWEAELKAMPFMSKEKGRMSHLLKQKSKIQAEHKPRVTYAAYDFSKRPRDQSVDKREEAKKPDDESSLIKIGDKTHKIKPKVVSKDVGMNKE